jgi:hypothetical protein
MFNFLNSHFLPMLTFASSSLFHRVHFFQHADCFSVSFQTKKLRIQLALELAFIIQLITIQTSVRTVTLGSGMLRLLSQKDILLSSLFCSDIACFTTFQATRSTMRSNRKTASGLVSPSKLTGIMFSFLFAVLLTYTQLPDKSEKLVLLLV